MKNMKRILLTMVAAMLLVVMSVAGTLAYLVSTSQQVTNTFTIGKVTIALDEAKTDEYGDEIAGAERVIANEYKLIPGREYAKDPTVHVVKGSEPSYIYVKITNEMKDYLVANCIEDQLKDNGWEPLTGYTGIYYYVDEDSEAADKSIVDARDAQVDLIVFETITLLDSLTDTEIAKAASKKIVIQAYALQADGFDSPAEAYAEAECTWPTNAPTATPEVTPDAGE